MQRIIRKSRFHAPSPIGGIISHSVSWNGHSLVGYSLALLIGMGFVGLYVPKVDEWVNVMAHAPAPANTKAPAPATTTSPASTASSPCQQLQEDILNGTELKIVNDMNQIVIDKTANATARQYAGYYTGRDAANKSVQEKEIPIVQFYCNV